MSRNRSRLVILERLNTETNTWEAIDHTTTRNVTLQAHYATGEPWIALSIDVKTEAHAGGGMSAIDYINDIYFTGKNNYNLNKGIGYRYAAFRNPEWRTREARRILSAEYNGLPSAWAHLEPIQDHYAHVSYTNTALIAFTPDASKGELDIQVTMKAGRYLTKFYPTMAPDEVRRLAAVIEADLELHFAVTADEIVKAYLNGPSSCMSHPKSHYSGHIHPGAVYGDSDLQLAYLKRGDRVTDRCLVWPERKVYGRVYGGADGRIETALQKAGYSEGTSRAFRGAKIRCIPNENGGGYIMPYIDGPGSVDKLSDEWFAIDGDINASSTSGVIDDHSGQAYCEYHDDYFDEDEMIFLEDISQTWHNSTIGDAAFYCEYIGLYYSMRHTDMVTCSRGRTYSQAGFEDAQGYYCEGTEEYIVPTSWRSGTQPITMADTDMTYSTAWVTDNAEDFHHCTVSGDWYEDATEAPDYVASDDDDDASDDAAPVAPMRLPMNDTTKAPSSPVSVNELKPGMRVRINDANWTWHGALARLVNCNNDGYWRVRIIDVSGTRASAHIVGEHVLHMAANLVPCPYLVAA